jgi:hypothetical protein
MKPFSNHAVVTPESTVCRGGHFLSTTTIRQTCLGFLTTFAMRSIVTNTEHTTAALHSFQQLIKFWNGVILDDVNGTPFLCLCPCLTMEISGDIWPPHVQNITEFSGIVDIFSLANIVEISEILHPQAYDPMGLPMEERLLIIEGRRQSRQLVECILTRYSLDNQTITLFRFYWDFLRHQTRAITAARKLAESRGIISDTLISDRLPEQIRMHFTQTPEFFRGCKITRPPTSFFPAFPNPSKILKHDVANEGECLSGSCGFN